MGSSAPSAKQAVFLRPWMVKHVILPMMVQLQWLLTLASACYVGDEAYHTRGVSGCQGGGPQNQVLMLRTLIRTQCDLC